MVKKEAATESKSKSKKEVAASANDGGFKLGAFLKGTKEELGKVVWPSRQQLISESAAVILMVSLSATLIYLVDQLFGWVSRQVF
ncbi:preprotein translocase subunit SecE [Nodosilinea sp. P-1105]|uniref:preprotein translocase subunit SecE n=1 Tax=Nodosilinea sp. P-1105 TaxID=2546229 RepID=UPI00146E3D5B|nr:preprotein translocase subunit SecE [Nodosilinea sp. P-1105]